MKIIIPTIYDGGIEPEEPKEYDIWQNSYTDEIFVYTGEKWLTYKSVKYTSYTELQEKELEKRKNENKEKMQIKINKYENFFKQFKEIIEDMEDKQ